MNNQLFPCITFSFIALLGAASQANAYTHAERLAFLNDLPAVCFNNEADYKTYKTARDAHYASNKFGDFMPNVAQKQIDFDLKYSQPSPGADITLDASGSKVPSGHILYQWNNDKAATGATHKVAAGASGSTQTVSLWLMDEMCGINYSKKFPVVSK
ncbi:hypothetical protein [Pseudomonas japonica]|uniref:Uncharacterized protein n=1 Tax=Pseudomonas japonica TaxID=256466 RepID=A0A239J9I7_9PSED|nr:hypothetical protein [Pseudomonas japonica]SNT02561.1 hypothetical protein SAMN05444352_12183 [Pseudomonas japonica]